MTILIVSRKRMTGCAMKSHVNEANHNDTVLLCRTVKQAWRIINYQKIDVVMLPDYDLASKAKLSEFNGEVRTFSETRNDPNMDTRTGRIDYYVGRAITIMREYWDNYGIRKAWTFPAHFAVRWILEAVNLVKPIVVVSTLAHRIGHQAYNTHVFMLKQSKLAKPPVVIAVALNPANKQLLKMQERHWLCAITGKWLSKLLHNPVMSNSRIWDSAHWHRDIDEPLYKHDGGEVFLKFTDEEQVSGVFLRKEMGVTDRPWHVCFHSRDPEYLAQEHSYISREGWPYHDFRDCNIRNYLLAARWLAQQGGYSIRMGAVVAEPIRLRSEDRGGVIDYATMHRSDFGDIYLTATSKFFLGTGCGLTQVATVFGVPVAAANYPILEWTTNLRKGDLYMPKLMWWEQADRYLYFNEWMESGAGKLQQTEEFAKAGLVPHENTGDEILELCQEMNAKLDGTWQAQEGDAGLMAAYNAIMKQPRYRCDGVEAEIATTFLRRHARLLRHLT